MCVCPSQRRLISQTGELQVHTHTRFYIYTFWHRNAGGVALINLGLSARRFYNERHSAACVCECLCRLAALVSHYTPFEVRSLYLSLNYTESAFSVSCGAPSLCAHSRHNFSTTCVKLFIFAPVFLLQNTNSIAYGFGGT